MARAFAKRLNVTHRSPWIDGEPTISPLDPVGLASDLMAVNHDHSAHGRKAARSRNWEGPWRKTPGRLFGTAFIRLYQLTLSGFIGNTCRHMPTCSEYAYEAIARHGLWAGGWMGLFRYMRCGPWGTHGIDNVPETLEPRFAWYLPWRYWGVSKAQR